METEVNRLFAEAETSEIFSSDTSRSPSKLDIGMDEWKNLATTGKTIYWLKNASDSDED